MSDSHGTHHASGETEERPKGKDAFENVLWEECHSAVAVAASTLHLGRLPEMPLTTFVCGIVRNSRLQLLAAADQCI